MNTKKTQVDQKKYEALFTYMQQQYIEERDRSVKLEEKAVKYLGSITIVITAFVFLVRYVVEEILPPTDMSSWLVLISMVFTLLGLASSWSLIFRSIKLHNVKKMQSSTEILDFFQSYKLDSIYLALSKRYSEATAARASEYSDKLKYVNKAYTEIIFTGYSFLVFIAMLIWHGWK